MISNSPASDLTYDSLHNARGSGHSAPGDFGTSTTKNDDTVPLSSTALTQRLGDSTLTAAAATGSGIERNQSLQPSDPRSPPNSDPFLTSNKRRLETRTVCKIPLKGVPRKIFLQNYTAFMRLDDPSVPIGLAVRYADSSVKALIQLTSKARPTIESLCSLEQTARQIRSQERMELSEIYKVLGNISKTISRVRRSAWLATISVTFYGLYHLLPSTGDKGVENRDGFCLTDTLLNTTLLAGYVAFLVTLYDLRSSKDSTEIIKQLIVSSNHNPYSQFTSLTGVVKGIKTSAIKTNANALTENAEAHQNPQVVISKAQDSDQDPDTLFVQELEQITASFLDMTKILLESTLHYDPDGSFKTAKKLQYSANKLHRYCSIDATTGQDWDAYSLLKVREIVERIEEAQTSLEIIRFDPV